MLKQALLEAIFYADYSVLRVNYGNVYAINNLDVALSAALLQIQQTHVVYCVIDETHLKDKRMLVQFTKLEYIL